MSTTQMLAVAVVGAALAISCHAIKGSHVTDGSTDVTTETAADETADDLADVATDDTADTAAEVATDDAADSAAQAPEDTATESSEESSSSASNDAFSSAFGSGSTDGMSEEEQVIASLEGWWAQGGSLGSATSSGYNAVVHIHDGEADIFDGNGQKTQWTKLSTGQVVRFDNGVTGSGDGGWYLYSLRRFLADSDPNVLVAIDDDGSNYSGSSSYVRIDGEPAW